MTIRKFIAIPILSFLFFSGSAIAGTLKDPEQVTRFSAQFIALIESGKASDAYDLLSKYVSASEKEFETIKSKALSNIEMINAELGQPLGSIKLRRETIESHFEKHTYLLKYKKAAIVWQVTWYQPDAGWQVMAVNFSANVDPFYQVKD